MEEIKHGHWVTVSQQRGNEAEGFWTERYLKCSECNYERRHAWLRGDRPDYCENCGADMRGEQK